MEKITPIKNKIKKKQIIIELFGFITRSMIKNNIADPLEVNISLTEFEAYINEKLGAHINSVQHIYQQIRAYERQEHVRLFKRNTVTNDIVLSLIQANDFKDKLFLHIGFKMAIAEGAYDLIEDLYKNTDRPLNIYLSAGSESYYFAQRLFQESSRELNLYTHNLGIIENYLNHYQHLENITIRTRFGIVSRNELAILEKTEDQYAQTNFDAIIASTTVIDDKGLYIESKKEVEYKKDIFQVMKGVRFLLLTLLEYNQPANMVKYPFAKVDDFDYIIIPSEKLIPKYRDHLKSFPFTTAIKYYNYEVLSRLNKKVPPQTSTLKTQSD